MKNTIKIISPILFLLMIFVYLNYFSSYVFPWQKEDAIQTTLNWGGLAKLPNNIENLKVQKEGTLFTRTFIIEFSTNKNEVENWIANSKRLKSNIPKLRRKNKIYDVYPGENESFGGTVKIEGNNVSIKMSWS
ncbi:hypothetical protein ABGT15_12970 [Flavobacterium enshiense]|uniref:hypothetical protein n=1 Tax=Flavobacterium enshiense TaxID=1341165 RepID=UPI00345CCED0